MNFNEVNANELDKDLTPEERQEWNSLYASYRSASLLSGTVSGVDSFSSANGEQTLAVVVIPYRIKIIIPEKLLWENPEQMRKSVTRNLLGAKIEFVITEIDRENNFCIGSRVAALQLRRKKFIRSKPKAGVRIPCDVLAVGKKSLYVEAGGYDLRLTQRDLNYSMMSDVRLFYANGQSLTAVVKKFAKASESSESELVISIRDAKPHPYEGIKKRHPVFSRRSSVIIGKYKGSVFCKLESDFDCKCKYSEYQCDEDFEIGDKVIIAIKGYDDKAKRVFGVIVSKWK
jgi:ribosomal protein S1